MTNIRPANDDSPVTDRPDVDTLAETVRGGILPPHAASNRYEHRKAIAALSDLAARARERDVLLRNIKDEAVQTILAKEYGSEQFHRAERLARRVTELEAALEEIEDGTTSDRIGQYSALRDWVNRTARGALAGDGGGADKPDDPQVFGPPRSFPRSGT